MWSSIFGGVVVVRMLVVSVYFLMPFWAMVWDCFWSIPPHSMVTVGQRVSLRSMMAPSLCWVMIRRWVKRDAMLWWVWSFCTVTANAGLSPVVLWMSIMHSGWVSFSRFRMVLAR